MRGTKNVQGILREIKATSRKRWNKENGLIIGKLLIHRACETNSSLWSRGIFIDFECHEGKWFDKTFVAINISMCRMSIYNPACNLSVSWRLIIKFIVVTLLRSWRKAYRTGDLSCCSDLGRDIYLWNSFWSKIRTTGAWRRVCWNCPRRGEATHK